MPKTQAGTTWRGAKRKSEGEKSLKVKLKLAKENYARIMIMSFCPLLAFAFKSAKYCIKFKFDWFANGKNDIEKRYKLHWRKSKPQPGSNQGKKGKEKENNKKEIPKRKYGIWWHTVRQMQNLLKTKTNGHCIFHNVYSNRCNQTLWICSK